MTVFRTLSSGSCIRIGCWDLAPAWLPLMCTKKIDAWSHAHSLSPVNADGILCWCIDAVYVQCQCICYVFKVHLWWEAPVDMRTGIWSHIECLGGVSSIGVWFRGGWGFPFSWLYSLKCLYHWNMNMHGGFCKGDRALTFVLISYMYTGVNME